jgi:hypothetical protein
MPAPDLESVFAPRSYPRATLEEAIKVPQLAPHSFGRGRKIDVEDIVAGRKSVSEPRMGGIAIL